jgi:hypothetical protein
MREKLTSLEEAAAVVKTGLVGLTTSTVDNAPMAFLRALIRRGGQSLGSSRLLAGA